MKFQVRLRLREVIFQFLIENHNGRVSRKEFN